MVALLIGALTVLRATDPISSVTVLLGLLLGGAYLALAVLDLRIAISIMVLELVLGGASGRWLVLPMDISGRQLLDLVLFGAVAYHVVASMWRSGARGKLGRYGPHALFLAIAGVGWMLLGLVNTNRPIDVWGDGNASLFFVFPIVLAVGASAGSGGLSWFRRVVTVACVSLAVATVVAYALIVAGVVTEAYARHLAVDVYVMGGTIERLNNGVLRLYLGSGIFLPVGVAIVTWRIVSKPAVARWWVALAIFVAALLATYTRGYWLAAFIAAAVVLAVGALRAERPLRVLAAAATVCVVALILVSLVAPAVSEAFTARVLSLVAGTNLFSGIDPTGGGASNEIKLEQAQVLLRHVAERPVLGWGFGSIARDYPYSASYSYELFYLDRLFKTGLVGLVLFLSLPARLGFDAARGLLGRFPTAVGLTRAEAVVPLAIVLAVLLLGGTNPYLAGSYGIAALLFPIAWLDATR